jgi:calcineurin-like phosphoesterase family protein
MDAALIQNWNEVVKPEDTVYHLGDVAFASPDMSKHILSILNGTKILILGNHDRNGKKMATWGFAEVHQSFQLELEGGILANLSHYPYKGSTEDKFARKFETKSLKDDGRLLLSGHVHDAWKSKPGRYKNHMINVGVDVWNYKPVSEAEILTYVKELQ